MESLKHFFLNTEWHRTTKAYYQELNLDLQRQLVKMWLSGSMFLNLIQIRREQSSDKPVEKEFLRGADDGGVKRKIVVLPDSFLALNMNISVKMQRI